MEDKPERRYQIIHQSLGISLPRKNVTAAIHGIGKRAGFDGIELNYDLEAISPDAGKKILKIFVAWPIRLVSR